MEFWRDGGELRTILVAIQQMEFDCGVAMVQVQPPQGSPNTDRAVFGDFHLLTRGEGYLIFKGEVAMTSEIKFRFVRTEVDNPKRILQIEGNDFPNDFRLIADTLANHWHYFIFKENFGSAGLNWTPSRVAHRGLYLNITGSFVLSTVNHANLIKSNYGGNLDAAFNFIYNCFVNIEKSSALTKIASYFIQFAKSNCNRTEMIDVMFWLLMVEEKNWCKSNFLGASVTENAASFSEYLHQLLAFGSGFQLTENVNIFESLLKRLSALPKGCFRWVVFYSPTWYNRIKSFNAKLNVESLTAILRDYPQVLMNEQVADKFIDYMCSNMSLKPLLTQLHEVRQKNQMYRKFIDGSAFKYLFSKKLNIDEKKLILDSDLIQQFSELPELNPEELDGMINLFYSENLVSTVLQLATLSPAYLEPLIDCKVSLN